MFCFTGFLSFFLCVLFVIHIDVRIALLHYSFIFQWCCNAMDFQRFSLIVLVLMAVSLGCLRCCFDFHCFETRAGGPFSVLELV